MITPILERSLEKICGRQAPPWAPPLRQGKNFVLSGQVVHRVDALNHLAKGKVARQDDVLPIEGDDQHAVDRPRADP